MGEWNPDLGFETRGDWLAHVRKQSERREIVSRRAARVAELRREGEAIRAASVKAREDREL